MANYKRKKSRKNNSSHYSSMGLTRRLEEKAKAKGGIKKKLGNARVLRSVERNYYLYDSINYMGDCPRSWNKLFHIRPARAKNHMLEKEILSYDDVEDFDGLFEDGRKPHIYYW